MELLILLIWVFLFAAVPLALIVASIIAFRSDVNAIRIIAGFPIGFFAHFIFAYITSYPMFFMVYAGAHTQPTGEALGWLLRGIFLLSETLYGMLAFSYCTFISGRKKPWPLKI